MARTLVQIILALSLFGPLNQAVASRADENLDGWLHNDLIPYLKSHFGRHPRLKGEPFQIRAMRDDRIVARMDGLTAYIRQRITDALQAVPEANLVRPIPIKPWTSPRSLNELRCPSTDRVKVQLTIEVERRPVSGEVKVSVQAIDLLEQAWVRGFKKVWTGELTLTEQRRLTRQLVDKGLIGSRQLPFREGQPDLLAAHQAAEVGCMLRQGGHRDVSLFLSLPQKLDSEYFRRASELLTQYLSALREVKIAEKRDKAGTLLTLQVHRIDETLYQVWTSLGTGKDSAFVEPSALAYVALPNRETRESMQKKRSGSSLISRFQLIAPTDQASCEASNPWEKGHVVLGQHSHLSSGGCFAIRYRSAAPSTLYLLHQTGNLQVTQLLPNGCNALNLGENAVRFQGNEELHIPMFSNGNPGYFRLDSQTGVEWIYAVAIAETITPLENKPVAQRLQTLLGETGTLCSLDGPIKGRTEGRLGARLKRLAREAQGKMEWRSLVLIHEGT